MLREFDVIFWKIWLFIISKIQYIITDSHEKKFVSEIWSYEKLVILKFNFVHELKLEMNIFFRPKIMPSYQEFRENTPLLKENPMKPFWYTTLHIDELMVENAQVKTQKQKKAQACSSCSLHTILMNTIPFDPVE